MWRAVDTLPHPLQLPDQLGVHYEQQNQGQDQNNHREQTIGHYHSKQCRFSYAPWFLYFDDCRVACSVRHNVILKKSRQIEKQRHNQTRKNLNPRHAQSAQLMHVKWSANGNVPIDGQQNSQPDGQGLRYVSHRVNIFDKIWLHGVDQVCSLQVVQKAVNDGEGDEGHEQDEVVGESETLEQEGDDAVVAILVEDEDRDTVADETHDADGAHDHRVEDEEKKQQTLSVVGRLCVRSSSGLLVQGSVETEIKGARYILEVSGCDRFFVIYHHA